jgi:hypothetical protein
LTLKFENLPRAKQAKNFTKRPQNSLLNSNFFASKSHENKSQNTKEKRPPATEALFRKSTRENFSNGPRSECSMAERGSALLLVGIPFVFSKAPVARFECEKSGGDCGKQERDTILRGN